MNSSPFMDKQILGLSGSPTAIGGGSGGGGGGGRELFNLISPQDEQRENGSVLKKEENLSSYDFQPIRPAPSPPTSSADDAAWHSRFSSGFHFGETTLGPDIKLARHYGASVEDVESTVKKYADILLHALEGMSSRLSQLESRTCILENSVDDLKVSIGNNYGCIDGKLRQMENILREVQTGVQVLRDKQEIAEAHLELAKMQLSTKRDHHQSENLQAQTEPQQRQAHLPLPQPPMQPVTQLSAVAPSVPPPPFPAPNAPPPPQQTQLPAVAPSVPSTPPFASANTPPPPQQIQLSSVPFTSQSPLQPQMSFVPSLPREQSYSMPPPQAQQYTAQSLQPNEPTRQQQEYQLPQYQQQHQEVIPQSQHYQPSHQIPQYSQPIRPEDSKSSMPPSQPYPTNIRQLSPPSQHPSRPPLHEYYGANPPLYELPPTSRPSSGSIPILSSYVGPGFSEPYNYSSSPSDYGIKQSPFSAAPPTSGGSGSYQRLPTAKILPQAVPAGSSSSSGGPSAGRVPIDDVVDKVSTMGFSKDQVRATVRKLTENGQSVDLNVVLDKLMNDREMQQPAKGWFGR